jgi:hypothetical protein
MLSLYWTSNTSRFIRIWSSVSPGSAHGSGSGAIVGLGSLVGRDWVKVAILRIATVVGGSSLKLASLVSIPVVPVLLLIGRRVLRGIGIPWIAINAPGALGPLHRTL